MMVLLVFVAVLLVMDIAISGIAVGVLLGRRSQRRTEETVQAAMDEEAAKEVQRGGGEMDEGFDNLMRFSVNGQDGFGGGGP